MCWCVCVCVSVSLFVCFSVSSIHQKVLAGFANRQKWLAQEFWDSTSPKSGSKFLPHPLFPHPIKIDKIGTASRVRVVATRSPNFLHIHNLCSPTDEPSMRNLSKWLIAAIQWFRQVGIAHPKGINDDMYRDMLSYERLSSSVCTQYISKLTITFHAGSYCTSPELLHILIFLRIEVPVGENSDPPIEPNVVKIRVYTAAAANDSFQSLAF